MRPRSFTSSSIGVLLLDGNRRPLYCNAEGASILSYDGTPQTTIWLDAVLPTLTSEPSHHYLRSGRRRYSCRAFHLDAVAKDRAGGAPRFLVVVERDGRDCADVVRWSDRFHLTSRERETVTLLLKGLSSKEIAAEMSITPSTVKTFLKLVMARTGTSTRAQIIAKVMERAGLILLPAAAGLIHPEN
jgi:DNA-binding CsgD family transcriptional regulator